MALASTLPFITAEEYLEGEKTSSVRHEYVDGQVFAMSGFSRRHNLIAGNLFAGLKERLRDTECDVFMNDVKVKVGPMVYYYPDILVTCDRAPQTGYVTEAPVLIVEVLSPSTEQIDRREKLIAYQRIPSLREYVIIAQDQALIEIHRRDSAKLREVETFSIGGDVRLDSLSVTIPVADVYRGIQLDDHPV
jgi:Uma2 family endonuclease